MTLETKHFAIEELKVDQADDGTTTVEGYGSVFGNKDSYGDIVMPGAFAATIAKKMPKMLWQHDMGEPIGVWDSAAETKRGLLLKGRIFKTARGLDAITLLTGGAIDGLSIGFTTKKYSIDSKSGVRSLEEVELFEVSLVTFPANAKALVTQVKSLDGVPFDQLHEHKRMVEAALRDAGASDQLATYVASLIPKPAPRDAGGEALIASITHATTMLKGITA